MLHSADRDADGFVTDAELTAEVRRRAIADDDTGEKQLRIASGGQRPDFVK